MLSEFGEFRLIRTSFHNHRHDRALFASAFFLLRCVHAFSLLLPTSRREIEPETFFGAVARSDGKS
jgi:hypothetical protein